MDALSNRNLTTHTYDETMAEKIISLIINKYFSAIKALQQVLKKEV
ncbi:nucleotidyltransferase substrate binding protein [Alteribacillus bidgolensis]